MIITVVLKWYLFIQIVAIITFFLTYKLFNNLSDKGYSASKVLGLLFTGLISWLIMSSTSGYINFNNHLPVISIGIIVVISIVLGLKIYTKDDYKGLYKFIDKKYKYIIFIELAFISFLVAGAYMRGFSPDILSVNKLQDFVYINSLMLSNTLPVDNLWLSGHKINYYYFGYFIIANQINLSQIAIESAFNLIPGTILGLIAITSGGIIYNITDKAIYGILGGFLTACMGSLESTIEVLEKGLNSGFDWWNVAHIIKDGVFTKFPLWSATLGDLEPYFIVHIVIITLLFTLYSTTKDKYYIKSFKPTTMEVLATIIISSLLAITIMTDLLATISALLIIIIIPAYNLFIDKLEKSKIIIYLSNLIITITIALLIDLPFLLSYKLPFMSISFNNNNDLTSIKLYIILFGSLLAVLVFFYSLKIKEYLKLNTQSIILLVISILSIVEVFIVYKSKLTLSAISFSLIFLLIIIASYSYYWLTKRVDNNKKLRKSSIITIATCLLILLFSTFIKATIPIIAALAMICELTLFKAKELKEFTTFGIMATLLSLIFIAELFNIKLITDNASVTMSYLIIQGQLLAPIILTLLIFITIPKINNISKDIYITTASIIILVCLTFLAVGPYYKSNKFEPIENLIPNLSGINHMTIFHPADYDAIEWFKENTTTGTIILEGYRPNDSYSGRITAYSGRHAILQWGHNQLFAYGPTIKDELSQRENDIKTIYEENDKTKVVKLLKKYNIEYIYVGKYEQELYKEGNLKGFADICNVVFQTETCPDCKIYKLKGDSTY